MSETSVAASKKICRSPEKIGAEKEIGDGISGDFIIGGFNFISISILRGKRKPGEISKKRGKRVKSAVEKQVWQGLDGKNAAFR